MRYATTLLAAVLLLLAVAPASAASFDCAKAATRVEKTVCADPALSRLDETLARAFATAVAASLDPQTLRADQRVWLAGRGKAASAADLARDYDDRVAALEALATAARAARRDVAAATLATACVDPPPEAECRVERSGAVQGDASLRYQLQAHLDGGLRVGGGVVVLRPLDGTPGRVAPIAAVSEDAAHFQPPVVVRSAVATWLRLPGHLEGTGAFNVERLFVLDARGLHDVDVDAWQHDLVRRLPAGLAVTKGIYPDYAAMSADTPLWRAGDPNCCPTGGRALVRLGLQGQRLVITSLRVQRGEGGARDETATVPAPPPPAALAVAPDVATVCGTRVTYHLDVRSFAADRRALDTARARGPALIHEGFEALCARRLLDAADVGRRVRRIVIQWAGGADDFAAYFASEHGGDGELTTQWAWAGADVPAAEAVRTGLLCAFRPRLKACEGREP